MDSFVSEGMAPNLPEIGLDSKAFFRSFMLPKGLARRVDEGSNEI